jgi:hypothetical protein
LNEKELFGVEKTMTVSRTPEEEEIYLLQVRPRPYPYYQAYGFRAPERFVKSSGFECNETGSGWSGGDGQNCVFYLNILRGDFAVQIT